MFYAGKNYLLQTWQSLMFLVLQQTAAPAGCSGSDS